jgi:hypothetical protein
MIGWRVLGLAALAIGAVVPAAHAEFGTLLTTITLPAAATCSASDSGSAVAIVSGGRIGSPKVPIALVTSCVQQGQAKLFFLDPSTEPATLLKTVNTTVTPAGGWQSLTLRADKADLLGCGTVNGVPAVHAIDFKTDPATATKLFDSPAGSTCRGLTWDAGTPKRIYQSASGDGETPDVRALSDLGGSVGADVFGGCPAGDGALTGLSVGVATTTIFDGEIPSDFSGPILFVACPAPAESEITPTIRMIVRSDGTHVDSVDSPTRLPGDLECDPVSFAIWQSWHPTVRNKDVVWVKDTDTQVGDPHRVFAVEAPFAACGPVPPPPPCPEGDADSDGDGLLDCWENPAYWDDGRPGIRYAGTWSLGAVAADERDITLCVNIDGVDGFGPADGACATPDKRDAFIELDYMTLHRPLPDAVSDVVAAFAAAPAFAAATGKCTDCPPGIRLHVRVDEEILHVDRIALGSCTGPLGVGDVDFDAIKSGATGFGGFGTAAERASTNAINARRFVYRYGIFAHNQAPTPPATSTSSSGCAEFGNDFIVTLGSWALSNCTTTPASCTVDARGKLVPHNIGSRTEQSGTLMHESGHNLRLRHGGDEDKNCKPNYPSVMNYVLQMPNTVANRPLDFSRQALLTLSENSLNEVAGVGGVPPSGKVAFGPLTGFPPKPTVSAVGANLSVNWNRDADSADGTVSRDLTAMTSSSGACPPSATPDVLTGFNDWENIALNPRASTDFADGVGLTFETDPAVSVGTVEIDLTTALELSRDIIDVKPQGDPKNTISLMGSSVLAVAIMSRRACDDPGCPVEVDTTTMDPSTVTLRGLAPATWVLTVKQGPRGNYMCRASDENKDGLPDLVCKFDVANKTLTPLGTQRAVLEGAIPASAPTGEYFFRGSDALRVVR